MRLPVDALTWLIAPLVIWSASPAQAVGIYWTNLNSGIGSASLDGSNVNQSFLTGVGNPSGVAVDQNYVYWSWVLAIGRSRIDGTDVNPFFILDFSGYLSDVTVDGSHIYWSNEQSSGTIGRANLDGTEVNPNFITGVVVPQDVEVDAEHIYWTNTNSGFLADSIGRANLDGTAVDQAFIPGLSFPYGLAVDEDFIYWVESNSVIVRANLDGTGKTDFITGLHQPGRIAFDDTYVYFTSQTLGTIGRANRDGTNVNESFITGATFPLGVAVLVPEPASGGLLALGLVLLALRGRASGDREPHSSRLTCR